MQLHYRHMPGGNFGDDLNALLWPELFPDLSAHHPDAVLYGIGTLLGGSCPPGRKIVLGSGSGYRRDSPLDAAWRVYWVRGALTAGRVGVDPALGLGDPALLWSGLRARPEPVGGRIGLVPHCKSWDDFDWPTVARAAGLHAIDPHASPARVADELRGCERVLTESLHGAVFASALGVPWRAVALARRFNDFKWRDWHHPYARASRPLQVAAVEVELLRRLPLAKALANMAARLADRGGAAARNAMRPLRAANARDVARVARTLDGCARDEAAFELTPPAIVASQREAMLQRCTEFARDHGLRFAG